MIIGWDTMDNFQNKFTQLLLKENNYKQSVTCINAAILFHEQLWKQYTISIVY